MSLMTSSKMHQVRLGFSYNKLPGSSSAWFTHRYAAGLMLAFGLLTGISITSHAQARATATRLFDGQVGGAYSFVKSDYAPHYFNGLGVYADVDFKHNIGIEAEFHYASDQDSYVNVYERTYEIGARYSRHYGKFQPYGKALIGRGVFNAPFNTANLAYNLIAFGGGTDYRLNRFLNARADFEFQHWFAGGVPQSTVLPNGITPTLASVGIAYHFK